MYIPQKFKVEEPTEIHSFIRNNAFGLLLTSFDGEIHDTHTPFVLADNKECIYGHIARANPHWRHWRASTRAKVIFTGPHAYVSPTYYISEFNVPTWNYTAVSVAGSLSIVEEEANVLKFLDSLTAQHEQGKFLWTRTGATSAT